MKLEESINIFISWLYIFVYGIFFIKKILGNGDLILLVLLIYIKVYWGNSFVVLINIFNCLGLVICVIYNIFFLNEEKGKFLKISLFIFIFILLWIRCIFNFRFFLYIFFLLYLFIVIIVLYLYFNNFLRYKYFW